MYSSRSYTESLFFIKTWRKYEIFLEVSQKTWAASVCQLLGQTLSASSVHAVWYLQWKDLRTVQFPAVKMYFPPFSYAVFNWNNSAYPVQQISIAIFKRLFTHSLLRKPFFRCFSLFLWDGCHCHDSSLILASLFFLCFSYIFIIRFLIWWPPVTILASPYRSGCILIHLYYLPAFLITLPSSSFFLSKKNYALFSSIKKIQSSPRISTLKDPTAIYVRCLMPWFHPIFSSPELSKPFYSPFYSTEPTVSITILIHICLRLKISPLSSPSSLVSCPYHNSQTPLLNYFLSLASMTLAALSSHVSLAKHSVSLYFQGPCVFTHDCMEFWFWLLSLLCVCLCLSSLIH